MDAQYEKAIHHISTLILQNNYRRADNILTFLAEQGITNSETTVLQSYCIKNLRGINAAIEYVVRSPNKGPVLDMALAQYYKQLNQNPKSLQCLLRIQGPVFPPPPPHPSTDMSTMIQTLKALSNPSTKPPAYINRYGDIDIQAINIINSIVQKHKTKQITAQVASIQLKQLKIQRNVVGKLNQIIGRFVRYLQHQVVEINKKII